MHFCYKLITFLIYPLSPLYLLYRKLKKKEHPTRYKEKLSKISLARGDGFLIWFHVASVGEAMSILPLIDECIKDKKIRKILITTITLSSSNVLDKKFNNNPKVVHQFLPLDITLLINKFLNHWKPNLSIFIDSEIWPNLITQTKKMKIPLLLVNARITKKTFNRWKFLKNFSREIFGKFDLCIASNIETKEFLTVLGAKNIKNIGNLKFSNIKNISNKKLEDAFLVKIKNRKIWCAASTHSPEEILCGKSHLEIKKIYKNVLTIIIPRHIDRSKKIFTDLETLNLKVVASSNLNPFDADTDILIVDSYGEALKFYNISKCVFLGKSLVDSLVMDSGQNPIEPARLGCKILHGPNVSNFHEIYSYFKTLGITKEIHGSSELIQSVVEELENNNPINHDIIAEIENYGQNIFKNVIMELKKYI